MIKKWLSPLKIKAFNIVQLYKHWDKRKTSKKRQFLRKINREVESAEMGVARLLLILILVLFKYSQKFVTVVGSADRFYANFDDDI